MANEGTFRPLKLILPPGKILSADPTAPMGNVFDAVPDRDRRGDQGAGEGAARSACRAAISAPIRASASTAGGRTASFFDTHDSGHGGWGACATHDGSGPFRTMAHGDTRIIPLELQESLMPFRIEEFSLREDSGGAGKFRGGLGFRKSYRILRPCQCSDQSRPHQVPALGRAGRQGGHSPAASRWSRPAQPQEQHRRQGERLSVAAGRSRLRRDRRRRRLWSAGRARASTLIQRDLDAGYIIGSGSRARLRRHGRARTARRGDKPRCRDLCRAERLWTKMQADNACTRASSHRRVP